jgi:hypothetical protein
MFGFRCDSLFLLEFSILSFVSLPKVLELLSKKIEPLLPPVSQKFLKFEVLIANSNPDALSKSGLVERFLCNFALCERERRSNQWLDNLVWKWVGDSEFKSRERSRYDLTNISFAKGIL